MFQYFFMRIPGLKNRFYWSILDPFCPNFGQFYDVEFSGPFIVHFDDIES